MRDSPFTTVSVRMHCAIIASNSAMPSPRYSESDATYERIISHAPVGGASAARVTSTRAAILAFPADAGRVKRGSLIRALLLSLPRNPGPIHAALL